MIGRVRELHQSIEGLKERIREVEKEVKKAEKGKELRHDIGLTKDWFP